MTVLLTLTTAGVDSGPFDLYSNMDGFVTPFVTGVSKAALQAGYTTTLVPNYTTIVRVLSKGTCVNYIDITLITPISSTSSTSSTSSSSSTSSTTTTSSTTAVPTPKAWYFSENRISPASACAVNNIADFTTGPWYFEGVTSGIHPPVGVTIFSNPECTTTVSGDDWWHVSKDEWIDGEFYSYETPPGSPTSLTNPILCTII